MSLSVEASGRDVRVIDTDVGDLAKIPNFFPAQSITNHFRGRFALANGASDTALDFGTISAAKGIYIKTDAAGEITFKLNGGVTAGQINPSLLLTSSSGGLTGMTLSNASGAAVIIDYIIAS